MHKKNTRSFTKIILFVSVAASVAVMILSAAAASVMYRPNGDSFTSSLGRNFALLCSNSDCGLSQTQLSMIENAEIRNIRYETDGDGNRLFFARMIIHAPKSNAGKYTDFPEGYLKDSLDKMSEGGKGEECDIVGICRDNIPIVDTDTVRRIAEAADKAWLNESLTVDTEFEYAITDLFIPEPFPDRVFSEGTGYQAVYSDWLDQCAAQFAGEGMSVTVNGVPSSEVSDIRAAMEQSVTPFLCSVRNISLARSESQKGTLTLSFDSLDVITTLHTAKKPSISGINKLCGVYSDERTLRVSIDIDVSNVTSGNERMKLPFFNIIRAVTRYCSTIGSGSIKIKMPDSPQIIAGQPNGQWPIEFRRTKGDGNVIVNVIKIGDTGEETSVLKLFLTDGGKTTVCLAKGQYRLNMAVGSTYYGSMEFFGETGVYIRDLNTVYNIPSKDLTSITVEKQPAESLGYRDYFIGQGTDEALIFRSQF